MQDDHRPNPDELLERFQQEEKKAKRGKLKIFFGAAAGVGKTYAMLDAAHLRQSEGVDVVVGYVEPHPRPETAALLEGLEVLPPRQIAYKSASIPEFDLDAALARQPAIILVDELAHTNAPTSRHPKRWQDVEELLEAGISVYTTVNVQHIESLNDVVAQITGVIVRETVPDFVIENADDVELVDLPPDELLKRLTEGKIYRADQAEQAIKKFFRKGNLIALRELSLRRTAERVDDQMQEYKRAHAISEIWAAGERLLVCISPSPLSVRLIRATARMAASLHADWYAVYVEKANLSPESRARVAENLRFAEQLGAQTVTLSGQNISQEIITYAHRHNINKVVVGKPIHPAWRDLLFGSVLNDLVRQSGTIDIYVMTGEDEDQTTRPIRLPHATSRTPNYVSALLIVAICTGLARVMFPYFSGTNLVMVYLMGVVAAAVWCGRGPATIASVVSVAAFDFFFIEPYWTFHVSDSEYLLTFIIMLLVALTISNLTARMKQQAEFSRMRELRISNLYEMSRAFARSLETHSIVQIAIHHIGQVFDGRVVVLLPTQDKTLLQHSSDSVIPAPSAEDRGVAQWVLDHGQMAGLNTETLPGAQGLYLPLNAAQGTIGVLGIFPQQSEMFVSPEQLHLLETFANQTALAIERTQLAQQIEMPM